MKRLLLETATDVCSVAVADGDTLLAAHTAEAAHRHSSHLTLYVQQVVNTAGMKLAELDEVVLSDGPGSYTSLRVGAATAKGLCVALPHLKIRVVPTLTALALAAPAHDEMTLATINSRRGEVYAQLFDFRTSQAAADTIRQQEKLLPPLLRGPQNLRLTEPDWLEEVMTAAGSAYFQVCGSGQERVHAALKASGEGENIGFTLPSRCSAASLLAPAAAPPYSRQVDVASYEPFYLNAPFVTKSKKKLLGR